MSDNINDEIQKDFADERITEEELAERERRAMESIDIATQATQEAARSLRIWAAAVKNIITNRPSIGDSLLEARDREG